MKNVDFLPVSDEHHFHDISINLIPISDKYHFHDISNSVLSAVACFGFKVEQVDSLNTLHVCAIGNTL